MKKLLMFMLLLTLSIALVACGSSDKGAGETPANTNDQAGSADQEITIEASNWKFDQEVYTVKAGDVKINLKNAEGMHGIQILDTDVSINGNGSATTTLEPGEYDIICSIQCGTGHADMVSKLVVE